MTELRWIDNNIQIMEGKFLKSKAKFYQIQSRGVLLVRINTD